MQVIGLCRFSYPGYGGFQVGHDTLQERIAYLYAPARMEQRFRTFEALTLPPLRAQTDTDFTFLIITGDTLPHPYRDRLKDLVADIPQAMVVARPPERHRPAMQAAINSVRRFDQEPCLQFRMDDDDAVAINYVQQLREVAQDVRTFAKNHDHIAIDFNQGFIAHADSSGIKAVPTQVPYTTAALALMFQPQVRRSVMNFAHAKVGRNMPTITMSGSDMLIRGHNDYNDSRQKPGIKPIQLSPLDLAGEAHFEQVFNINSDNVRRIFSAVPD